MRSEKIHNHQITTTSPYGLQLFNEITHSHALPDEAGHTHEAIVGPATTTKEIEA